MKQTKEKGVNWKIIAYSLIALISLGLMWFVDWLFIIPAALMVWLNQKELMKNN